MRKDKETQEIYDYLMQVRDRGKIIYRKEIQSKELRACLTRSASLQPTPDRVKSSPSNRLEEIEAKVDELDRELDLLREDKAHWIMEISDLIESLDDETEKTILTMFFVGQKSMSYVADMIAYSLKHTYRIRKRALVKLQEKIGGDENEVSRADG